ncbi:Putative Beta-tubulin (Fragment) [Rhizopus microsporus]
MSGASTNLRFLSQFNLDLCKHCVNMIPFPCLYFFTVGFAPLTSLRLKQYCNIQLIFLSEGQMFDARSMMVSANLQQGRYLTAATICWVKF